MKTLTFSSQKKADLRCCKSAAIVKLLRVPLPVPANRPVSALLLVSVPLPVPANRPVSALQSVSAIRPALVPGFLPAEKFQFLVRCPFFSPVRFELSDTNHAHYNTKNAFCQCIYM
jgi:hypothetical protein